MIITASPFFNEVDLLEVRMHELSDEVAAHVIVEAPLTFTGIPKPLHFENNKARFKAFNIHHSVCLLPEKSESPWEREMVQYHAVIAAVKKLNPSVVIWIDADEIPRRGTVQRFIDSGHKTMTLDMDMLLFGFNRIDVTQRWKNGKIGWFNPNDSIQPWRGMEGLPELKEAGWHCEYFGAKEELLAKLNAVSHAPDEGCRNMRRLVDAGQLPGMERTEAYPVSKWPRDVFNNIDKYRKYYAEK